MGLRGRAMQNNILKSSVIRPKSQEKPSIADFGLQIAECKSIISDDE
jgi:hypothetical protein